MSDFIACTSKYLPPELAIVAAETAVRQNPTNRPMSNSPSAASGLILGPEHLAVMTSKWWGPKGVRLTTGFMEQTPVDLQRRVLSHLNAWHEWANVEFVPTQTDPQVRITRSGEGYWSYLGTDILHIPKNEATMCLQGFTMQTPEGEFRRVARHEAGHTLGMPHEHMRRSIIERIDAMKAIAYFRQTQGWSAAMVQSQVLTPLAESSLMATPDADEASIMTYSLPGLITKDGRPIPGGKDIEEQDRDFVAKIYPKAPAPPPPPLPPADGLEFEGVADFKTKTVFIRKLTAGWKMQKASTTPGESNVEPQFVALADELETALPPEGAELDAAKQGATGGIIAKVLELIAALRAQDIKAIAVAVRDLLNILLGEVGNGGGISFQQQAAAARFDWSKLIGVLLKLLPLLLGA